MKLLVSLALLMSTSVGYAQSLNKATYSSTYSTLLVELKEMECSADEMKPVKASSGEVIGQLCAREYRECMFEGSCVLETEQGQKMSISFERYDEKENQSYFTKSVCDYGYGFGKVSGTRAGLTCLLPYFSVSADALEYKLGDVVFVPKLKDVQLPNGEIHDGYVIVSDYSESYLDTGADHFSFFTGHENAFSNKNPLVSLGLSDPTTIFEYRKATELETKKVQEKRGFKILRTFKKKFKAPSNPMLEVN